MSTRPSPSDAILPFIARHLVHELRRSGVDAQFVFAAVGFRPEDLDLPDFCLSFAQYRRLIHGAQRVTRDPLLPLRVGMELNPAVWGAVLPAMLACTDSHALLALATRNAPAFTGLMHMDLISDAAGVLMIAGLPNAAHDPVAEAFLVLVLFAAISRLGRMIVGPKFAANRVSLSRITPGHIFQHHCGRTLQCEVAFSQPRNAMMFSHPAWLIPTADVAILGWIEQHWSNQPAVVPSRDTAIESAVRRAFVRRQVPAPTLAEVAEDLHMSPRTLRRRLDEQGTRFSELVDDQRRDAALRLLRNGAYTLGQVAAMVGFADHRGLRRAVQRWTGRAPKQFLADEAASGPETKPP